MNNVIKVTVGRREYYLPAECIVHAKADGNCTHLHTTDGARYLLTKNLRQVGLLLPDFWQLHRSHLVNPNFVSGWSIGLKQQGRIRLSTGLYVPVARRRLSGIAMLIRSS